MFARYFVELPVEPEVVVRAFSDAPRRWLPGLARDANHRGDELLAEVGFGEAIRVKREVVVALGAPVRSVSKTVFRLRWEAAGHPGLFPALDADLEVAPLGPERTQLSMSARYVPPFGAMGRVIDRALLSRVAEATLKDFLDRVREAVLSSLEGQAGHEQAGHEPRVPESAPVPGATIR